MKIKVLGILLTVLCLISITGCAKEDLSTSAADTYTEYIEKLPEGSFYAQVDLGLERPILLVTDAVYDNMDGNTCVTIYADAYYPVNGTIKKVDSFESNGTAYPLYVANNGIYVCGNHFGTKYVFNEEVNAFEVAEGVNVIYEQEDGEGTYTSWKGDESAVATEYEFEKFFQYTNQGSVINFTPVSSKNISLAQP